MPPAPPDPVVALSWFAVLVVVASLIFWPRRGVVARAANLARVNERVRLEDALKQLHRAEYDGAPATIDSVAGALQVSRAAATRLLVRLEEMELARAEEAGFALTADGRAYALRVLRTHRLWERYLADRTGVRPEEWHDEAERFEHMLSSDATDRLAASLGHPLYDPHGDPIPSAAGELPPRRGVALTALRAGETAVIAHLEDEPREIYERLISQRLAPRLSIEMLDAPTGEVRFRTNRGEHRLAPAEARNVTVEPLPLTPPEPGSYLSLADIDPGNNALVVSISPLCEGSERRRLLDMGVVPGTAVQAEFRGAAGGPTAYRVRGALIALRTEQASRIQVERAPEVAAE